MTMNMLLLVGLLSTAPPPVVDQDVLADIMAVEPAESQPADQPMAEGTIVGTQADGYRGIWYANQKLNNPYVWKYSGGLGTYCAKHTPIAIYSEKANKTFFVYGGTNVDAGTTDSGAGNADQPERTLLAMVSYYDHATNTVPKPTIVIDKKTTDAHDNPVISIDDKGHIWVFVAAHGTARPSYIFKSVKPFDIEKFELIKETNFSYPQPWYVEGQGFIFLHTRYVDGKRFLYSMTSPDGKTWSEPLQLAAIENGHYGISRLFVDKKKKNKPKVGLAFNMHPSKGGLNARTNLYYIESEDFGKTWRTSRRRPVQLPLTDADNPALVRNYADEGRLVYLKDMTFDSRGNPLIMHLFAKGYQSGPKNDPRFWSIVRWTGREWEFNAQIRSDNNYDTGVLHLEKIDLWRVIGPSDTGPQPYNTGGEMVMWTTENLGRSWTRKTLTADSRYNHTYARRPVNANDAFYAFWADGHGREPSPSRLYFCNKEGDVFQLPAEMTAATAQPVRMKPVPPTTPEDVTTTEPATTAPAQP